jgi:hypothetical protein
MSTSRPSLSLPKTDLVSEDGVFPGAWYAIVKKRQQTARQRSNDLIAASSFALFYHVIGVGPLQLLITLGLTFFEALFFVLRLSCAQGGCSQRHCCFRLSSRLFRGGFDGGRTKTPRHADSCNGFKSNGDIRNHAESELNGSWELQTAGGVWADFGVPVPECVSAAGPPDGLFLRAILGLAALHIRE